MHDNHLIEDIDRMFETAQLTSRVEITLRALRQLATHHRVIDDFVKTNPDLPGETICKVVRGKVYVRDLYKAAQ